MIILIIFLSFSVIKIAGDHFVGWDVEVTIFPTIKGNITNWLFPKLELI